MAGRRIGILAEDEHADIGQRPLESAKDLVARRKVAASLGDFPTEEATDLLKSMALAFERRPPIGRDRLVHMLEPRR
jgi:hypothetical protein